MSNEIVRVAVTGAGGGVGQSIIKALEGTNYEAVALDGEALGTGLYAANSSYVIPYSNAPNYIERLLQICKQEGCTLLFPGLDAELPVLSKSVDRFNEIGTTVIVSSLSVVEIGDDKLTMFERLAEAGIRVPNTIDMGSAPTNKSPLPYPFILKPRVGGARSKDVYLVTNDVEYSQVLEKNQIEEFIAQEYIEGDEYTCGSITLGGECKGVIVMRRILRDGDTYKCFSVKNKVIEEYVRSIVTSIQPFGACNVQLRLKDGVPYIFEVNARCSGTTAARALCGFNEPKLIADYVCSGIEPSFDILEQTVLRYWKELVVPNGLVETLSNQGHLERQEHPVL
jgi:carbamoyl-phosphate synthase large subunit